jgi:hypothetical protein
VFALVKSIMIMVNLTAPPGRLPEYPSGSTVRSVHHQAPRSLPYVTSFIDAPGSLPGASMKEGFGEEGLWWTLTTRRQSASALAAHDGPFTDGARATLGVFTGDDEPVGLVLIAAHRVPPARGRCEGSSWVTRLCPGQDRLDQGECVGLAQLHPGGGAQAVKRP